jgi:hypothetical protein
MEEVTEWLQRQAGRQRNAVYLENALLTDQFSAYAAFRLRYFLAGYLMETVVHTVKVIVLARVFVWEDFATIGVLYACAALVSSFWWGSLEVMRGRIRHLYRFGKSFLIPREIGRWVSLSGQLAVVTMIAAIAYMLWHGAWQRRAVGPRELYVFSMLVGLALTFVTRCYHSGIYALRRIYRPLPAILALELAAFLAVLILWFWIGAWSVPLAAMFSTFVAAALTLYTTRRMYQFFGFGLKRFINISQRRAPWREDLTEVVAAGLSFATIRVDALLVVALVSTSSRPDGRLLYFLFILLSPTIHACFGWAQLFYFDLKRLEEGLFRHLQERFERSVWRLAWVLGLMFSGVAGLISLSLLSRPSGALLLFFAPFFVARSLLANAQVQTFVRRDYWLLSASGVLSLCGFAVVGFAPLEASPRLLLMAAACLIALVPIIIRRQRWRGSRGEPLALAEWVHSLQKVKVPVRVSVVQMDLESPTRYPEERREWGQGHRWRHRWFAEHLAWKLRSAGCLTLANDGRIAWYERVTKTIPVTEEWLLTQAGGRVARIDRTGVYVNGHAALDAACRLGYLGESLRPENRPSTAVRATDAREAFLQMLPQGVVYDPDESTPPFFHSLSPEEKRVILFDAVAFARNSAPSSMKSRFDVTVFSDAGGLRLIFVVGAEVDHRVRAAWRTLINRLNVQAALNGSATALSQEPVNATGP